ncbi:MAG: hypothetical protein AAF580_02000 [Pseudomonadota bacterium]
MEDVIGFLAAALVLKANIMQSLVKLRAFAMLANVAFICYGFVADSIPILALHSMLLPINAISIARMRLASDDELLTKSRPRQALRGVLMYRHQAA